EVADIIKGFKESRKTSKRLLGTEGLGKGTANIPRVHDESTVISATSSEGTGTEPGVLNREEIYSEEDDENKDDTDDDRSIDIENTNDKETEDELLQGVEQANDDEDEEMKNVEVEDSRKGDAKISDVAKADVEKTEEVKDDAKILSLLPTSSNLSVSSGM
nr:hypothetical protein [Tanacetum cinerariifolium]